MFLACQGYDHSISVWIKLKQLWGSAAPNVNIDDKIGGWIHELGGRPFPNRRPVIPTLATIPIRVKFDMIQYTMCSLCHAELGPDWWTGSIQKPQSWKLRKYHVFWRFFARRGRQYGGIAAARWCLGCLVLYLIFVITHVNGSRWDGFSAAFVCLFFTWYIKNRCS